MRGVFFIFILVVVVILLPKDAAAGVIEISAGFSFTQSHYSETSFSWNRRWGAALGYHLTELSQLELGFQDIVERTQITNYEDTTFHDKIFSANWLQAFAGRTSGIQPYVKVGVGQLNREASGVYWFGASPPAIVDSLTGILGAGMKIHITRTFGLRGEVMSYLTGGSISTWKNNTSLTTGISLYL